MTWLHKLGKRVETLVSALMDRNTGLRFLMHVLVATLVCVLISVAFAALSSWVQGAVVRNTSPELGEELAPVLRKRFMLDWIFVVLALLAAPVLETVLIAVVASVTRGRGWATGRTVLLAGFIFGVLHAANGVLAILPSACVFMVLTALYIHWRRLSFELAFASAALPHLLMNAGVVVLKAALA